MKKKIKVVVDANIFINSWFYTNHFYCDAILDLIDNDKIQLLFSQDTIGELIYVIKNIVLDLFDEKKLQYEYLSNLSYIFLNAISVNTLGIECQKLNDKFDEMFLKTAIKGKADYIVSDDFRSGIHGVKLEGTKILSSKQFVSMYEGLCV